MKVTIDVGAYERNLRALIKKLAPSELMAVVKDDAYGHGLERILPIAQKAGVRRFAVLDVANGLKVRSLLGSFEPQLFAWLFDSTSDFAAACEAQIELGVSNADTLTRIANSVTSKKALIHLKIDTGLHRNGCSAEEWPALIEAALTLQNAGRLEVVGVWSHIGEASEEEDARSRELFEWAVEFATKQGLNIVQRHLAASAASFTRMEFRYDFARVGGFTYGVAPGDGIGPAQIGLEAVMSAQAQITACDVVDGKQIATVNAGYIDGIPDWVVRPDAIDSLPKNGFEVSVEGVRAPIIHVASSHLLIDASDLASITVGMHVDLFGSHLDGVPVLQEWADALGTVGEEIVVRVGNRNLRTYKN